MGCCKITSFHTWDHGPCSEISGRVRGSGSRPKTIQTLGPRDREGCLHGTRFGLSGGGPRTDSACRSLGGRETATPDATTGRTAHRWQEAALLADGIEDRYRPLVILGAGAGLRIGEALGLTRGKVDFLRRSLSVTQQAVTVKQSRCRHQKRRHPSVRFLSGTPFSLSLAAWFKRNPRAPDELLVAEVTGAPIPDENRFSQIWARTVERVGLPAGTRHHDLRHTFASALIAAGCSVKAVQMALGHDLVKQP